jgi:hypothetical protein
MIHFQGNPRFRAGDLLSVYISLVRSKDQHLVMLPLLSTRRMMTLSPLGNRATGLSLGKSRRALENDDQKREKSQLCETDCLKNGEWRTVEILLGGVRTASRETDVWNAALSRGSMGPLYIGTDIREAIVRRQPTFRPRIPRRKQRSIDESPTAATFYSECLHCPPSLFLNTSWMCIVIPPMHCVLTIKTCTTFLSQCVQCHLDSLISHW